MPNPVFPTLTQDQDSSYYTVAMEDQSMKSEMEGGYQVSRAKHTRTARQTFTSGFTMLTAADFATLKNFYVTTVKGGSVIFDWTDPITATVLQVRFSGSITFKYTGAGTTQRFDVSFKLEQA